MNEQKEQGTTRFSSTWIIGGLILLIGLLNLFVRPTYAFFGVDHAAYLSKVFQVLWLLAALAATAAVARFGDRMRMPVFLLPLLALLSIASFPLLRTSLPGIHGDGEVGGYPRSGGAQLSEFPSIDGRLQAFAAEAVKRVVPEAPDFAYNFSGLYHNFANSNNWLLTVMIAGVLLALILTIAAARIHAPGAVRFGLLAVLLASPPMINAYGHFDSYIFAILLVGCWWIILGALDGPKLVFYWYLVVPLIVAVAVWAHPTLLFLAGYSMIYILARILIPRVTRLRLRHLLLAGMIVGLLPFLMGKGNVDLFRVSSIELIARLLHEKLMSCVQVTLPAIVLLAFLYPEAARREEDWKPLEATSWIVAASACTFFVTVWVGYGIRDELLYSIFGALVLGAALTVYLVRSRSPSLILGVAVLSMFLFVPRVVLYSGERMFDRFVADAIRDPCNVHRKYGPYFPIAGCTPVDTEAYRERKWEILREGFVDPHPLWTSEQNRITARAHYTAWCLEFGQIDEARRQLEWFITNKPDVLPQFWRGDGRSFKTDHYFNRCPRLSRILCEQILSEDLKLDPNNVQLQQLVTALDRAKYADPVIIYGPHPDQPPSRQAQPGR